MQLHIMNVIVTYQSTQLNFTCKFVVKCNLKFSAIVVVHQVALEYFVETFEEVGPETVDRSIVQNLVKYVGHVMEIGLD